MLVPYALRSPIAIDKAAEKQFPFFPLVSLARSKTTIPSSTVSIAKNPTIFQFSLLPPPHFSSASLESERKLLPDLPRYFGRRCSEIFRARTPIHRSSSSRI